ncbi:DUF6220 domain-containing protein [Naasia aerilata]|uniref:DUF4383 domain-containing protein n=1 Tax=Naasia aerilata TaxID=1162966 RepID=A0ABM8GEL0_9MICO|nr:DUF6220 domain-containing protein [Naasia aerilata]BDZ46759.1 hypothetical protein GCM10025866_26680 [Naasia aerilata]
MRKVFVVTAVLLALDTILQLYFAALGHFSTGQGELFGIHGFNGAVVLRILALVNILAAAGARAGRRTIWMTVIVFLLVLLQTVIFILTGVIFNIGPETPEIPVGASILLGFHGLNGLAIIALSGILVGRAIRHARGEAPAARTAAPVVSEGEREDIRPR